MDQYLSVDDVAKKLGVSTRTILREIKRGNLATKKAGRRYLVTPESLDSYLLRDTTQNKDIKGNIDAFLESKEPEMISLLQQLIAKPSESDGNDQAHLAKYLKEKMSDFGFRSVLYGKDDSVAVKASVGYKEEGILFDCPLDTAPVGNLKKWDYPPFDGVIKGEKMFGRGAVDCKGGMVAMIFASLAIKKEVKESNFRLEIVFDGGEHSGEYKGIRETLQRDLPVSCGIIGYGGAGNELAIGCRGYHRYKITSKGYSVHSGSRQKKGVNAISNMVAFLSKIDEIEFPKSKSKYFDFGSKISCTMIEGGHAINVVPDTCTAYLDVRCVPDIRRFDIEKILTKLLLDLKKRVKELDISFDYIVGQEGYVVDEESSVALSLKKAITTVRKNKPEMVVHGPAHIGTLLAQKKIPMVVYGPEGGNVHSYNEYVYLASILKTAKIYANFVLNYFER